MVQCKDIIQGFFKYQTPKLVTIHSLVVGIVSRLVQIIVVSYIIGYVIVYRKGYQDFSDVQSSVTTKVKGVTFTNFSDDEFYPYIQHPELYRRLWDVADYVVPPSENGATFVATNVVITTNQTQRTCAEDVTIAGAECDQINNTCIEGTYLPLGNGILTGECVKSECYNCTDKYSCQIRGWCPVEDDRVPLRHKKSLLAASEDFTILIKNFVDFPKFKNSRRRNIRDTANKTYLQSCRYDSESNQDCPVFRLGDIVKWAGENYSDLAYKGGVIAIVINWDCNFDWNKKYCFPTYSFSRLDDPEAKLAPGWNFRYANVYADNTRTLYKLFGIKFSIIVHGQAGKFMIIPLLLNVGAGLGLLALEVVICDIVVLYLDKRKKYYKTKKYEDTMEDVEKDFIIAPEVGMSSDGDAAGKTQYNSYQRLTE